MNQTNKLLIVHDEGAMRNLLRINLADIYEIVDTGNPVQALGLALSEKPGAILLDLGMPKYSGFELCRTFSSLSATQLIPIVIISGEAGGATECLCNVLGATACVEKPIDFDALRSRLAQVLRTSRYERRTEPRVRLRVILKLQGIDINDKPFEEVTATENVSLSGFLCGCTTALKKDSYVEVYLDSDGGQFVGKARVIRCETIQPYRMYSFRFVEKQGPWILR